MRKRPLSIALMIGILLSAAVPGAYAGTKTWAVNGGAYWTNSTDKQLTVRDTKADNREVVGYFYRTGSSSTTRTVKASGYLAETTSPTGAKILEIRACARNNNPLDANYCSGYHLP